MSAPDNGPGAVVPELLPCPFCGSAPKLEVLRRDSFGVRCVGTLPDGSPCYVEQRPARERASAIKRWNSRIPAPADVVAVPREDVDRIRGLMEEVFHPERFHAPDVWQLWKLLKRALRSSAQAGEGGEG